MNTLVVVAIAVIILLAMTAFFIGGFGPTGQDIQLKQDFQRWCNRWVQVNCKENDEYLVGKVFEAYNKWTQKYLDNNNKPCLDRSCAESSNECSGYSDCWNKKIVPELQSACGCWFIAPTTPEEQVTPATRSGTTR